MPIKSFGALLFVIMLASNTSVADNDIDRLLYQRATGGQCSTAACFDKYSRLKATGGQCSTDSCVNKFYNEKLRRGEVAPIGPSTKFVPGVGFLKQFGDNFYTHMDTGSNIHCIGAICENEKTGDTFMRKLLEKD